MRQTVQRNGGSEAICLQKAAGDHRSQLPLYLSKDNRGDNRLYPHEFQAAIRVVEVVPIDELLDELAIKGVDLVKIDVQGYESHVVNGMTQSIRQSERLVMMLEFWPQGLRQAGSDPLALLRTLRDCGLTIFELAAGASLIPVENDKKFVERFFGRRYTNLAAVKGSGLAH